MYLYSQDDFGDSTGIYGLKIGMLDLLQSNHEKIKVQKHQSNCWGDEIRLQAGV